MINIIRKAYARYQKISSTKRELNALSNRELSDIGISRSDISEIARRTY